MKLDILSKQNLVSTSGTVCKDVSDLESDSSSIDSRIAKAEEMLERAIAEVKKRKANLSELRKKKKSSQPKTKPLPPLRKGQYHKKDGTVGGPGADRVNKAWSKSPRKGK